MEREALRELQTKRLIRTIRHVYQNVPYYRNRMQEAGVAPGDIRSLEDLSLLPFTTKQDLRDNYPYGLFAVPLSEIVRIHASSGTTGKPTVVGYTQRDIQTWAELMARTLTAAGADKHSVIQNAYGYGLFTGGLGVHYGAELIGASVIPISGGNTRRQIMLMKDFGTTMLTCTPSYALYLAEAMAEEGIDPTRDIELKYGVFGAEPWTDGMRGKSSASWASGYRHIRLSGSSARRSFECEIQRGLHINEDHFLPEIIDPAPAACCPTGRRKLSTTLTKEGIPIIRTHAGPDKPVPEVCGCGRTHVRMSKVLGRTDDMLIIRGVNVFPTQVESVLVTYTEVEPHYLLVVDRVNNSTGSRYGRDERPALLR